MSRELISLERFESKGYEIRTEKVSGEAAAYGPDLIMKSSFTIPDGYYIGDDKQAILLVDKYGLSQIQPINTSESDANCGNGYTCQIGFSEREQKWYGWSHRAIFGFAIGDEAKEGDLCTQTGYINEYIEMHPEADLSVPVGFKALTLDDCKQMAIAYAESVG